MQLVAEAAVAEVVAVAAVVVPKIKLLNSICNTNLNVPVVEEFLVVHQKWG